MNLFTSLSSAIFFFFWIYLIKPISKKHLLRARIIKNHEIFTINIKRKEYRKANLKLTQRSIFRLEVNLLLRAQSKNDNIFIFWLD